MTTNDTAAPAFFAPAPESALAVWGKAQPLYTSTCPAYPLLFNMLDAACVAQAMLEAPLPDALVRMLVELTGLDAQKRRGRCSASGHVLETMNNDHNNPPPQMAFIDAPRRPDDVGEQSGGRRNRGDDIGYLYRDALRLLFILVEGSEYRSPDNSGTQRIFVGEKRLMAIDFLVRYPDYLANALLDLYERDRDPSHLKAVQTIFDNDEPNVRLVAMVRWRRGAFQNFETALSVLDSRGLVRSMRRSIGGDRVRHEFVIGEDAEEFLRKAVEDQPSLVWYSHRVNLVMRVAGQRSGSDLKDAQYKHDEYRTTAYGAVIPSIKDRVLQRLRRIEGMRA